MGTSAAAAKRHGPMVAVVVLLGAALIAASSALENEGHLIPFGVGAAVVVGLIALAATWNRLALAFGLLVGTGIAAFAVGLALTLTVDGAEGWLDCGGPCSTLQNATGSALVYGSMLAVLVLAATPVIAAARTIGRRWAEA